MATQCRFGNGFCTRMTNEPSGLCWQHVDAHESMVGSRDLPLPAPSSVMSQSQSPLDQLNDELDEVTDAIRTHGNVRKWLDQRYDELNRDEPQLSVSRLAGNGSTVGVEHQNRWVPMSAIFAADGTGHRWGVLNNRPDGMVHITDGLLDPQESREEWLRRMRGMKLVGYSGPHGETWEHSGDGRHRITALKALGITQWEFDTQVAKMPEPGDAVTGDATTWSQPEGAFMPRGMQSKKIRDHLALLQDAGIIDNAVIRQSGMAHSYSAELKQPIAASWELETPDVVELISRRYQKTYPQFGKTPKEAAMLSASTWTAYLQSRVQPSPAEPDARSEQRSWVNRVLGR